MFGVCVRVGGWGVGRRTTPAEEGWNLGGKGTAMVSSPTRIISIVFSGSSADVIMAKHIHSLDFLLQMLPILNVPLKTLSFDVPAWPQIAQLMTQSPHESLHHPLLPHMLVYHSQRPSSNTRIRHLPRHGTALLPTARATWPDCRRGEPHATSRHRWARALVHGAAPRPQGHGWRAPLRAQASKPSGVSFLAPSL